MPRRKSDPKDEAARGYPGRRKSKTDKAIAEAERLAQLLSDTPVEKSGDLAPPAFIKDPRLAPAIAVWKEYAPRLDKLDLLARLDRHTFALFCIYVAEFVTAQEDVLTKGYSVRVKTISGDRMPRINPSVERRDFAAKMVLDLSAKFGLTPLDRAKLIKMSASSWDDETLFGRRRQAPEPVANAEPEVPGDVADDSAVGIGRGFDTTPPRRMN